MYTGIHTVNIFKVGQNLICTVYIQYYWQGDHQIRGHTRCIHTVLSDINIKYMYGVRRLFLIFLEGTYTFGVGTLKGTSTPQTPLPEPPPRQKGYQSAPFWILHPSAYSLRPETGLLQSYGAKTEVQTPVHTWPTRHPQLTCTAPHRFHFFRILLIISCWHNPESLKWNAASLAWLLPQPAPEHVCLWLLDVSIDPPFYPICSKKVAIDWAWAKDSDDIFKLS